MKENSIKAHKIELNIFDEKYAEDFAKLNYEWLNKYFEVEVHDIEMLENPKKYIIDNGGEIILAKNKDEVVGTVALIKVDSNMVELAKMAVTEKYKGLKIGNKLMEKAIEVAKKMNFSVIMLESNRKLTPALNLYRKYGFVEVPLNPNTPYKRADIKMIKKLD